MGSGREFRVEGDYFGGSLIIMINIITNLFLLITITIIVVSIIIVIIIYCYYRFYYSYYSLMGPKTNWGRPPGGIGPAFAPSPHPPAAAAAIATGSCSLVSQRSSRV